MRLSRQSLEQFFLPGRHPGGVYDFKPDVLITTPAPAAVQPLAAQPELLSALRPGGYGHFHRSVEGRNGNLCPKGGLPRGDGEVNLGVVFIDHGEEAVGLDRDTQKQVTGRGVARAGLTLPGEAYD